MSNKFVRLTTRPARLGAIALAVVLPTAFVVAKSEPDAASRSRHSVVGLDVLTAPCSNAPLPTLGGLFGQAVAANQRGLVAGTATDTAGASHAVLWRAGKAVRLSTGTTGSIALGVNGRGDVVGIGRSDATPVGWAWSRGVTVRLKADDDEVAVPSAINDSGLVVGVLSENEGSEGAVRHHDESEHAAFWQSAIAEPTVLSPLPGDESAHAWAVDNRGRIGGVSGGTLFRAVIWDAQRVPRALAGLGGGYAAVRALADSGLAVGDAVSADGSDRPVMWNASGRITQLALPAGADAGQALAILPDGTIIGTADLPVAGGGVQTQAVRWTGPGAVALLSAVDGRTGSAAGGAADATSYAGYRTDPVGGRHPVLWRCGR
jgi:uncharacterized membrane protein